MKKCCECKSLAFIIAIALLINLNSAIDLSAMSDMPKKKPSVQTFHMENPKPVPLTIAQCYQLALKRSETIAIKKEEVEKTLADFLEASSVALGDVDFKITNFQQDVQPDASDDTNAYPERRERKFVISQPLFQGFKSFGAISGAGSLRKQRIEERIRAKQLLFLDVTSNFYLTFLYRKNVTVMEGVIESYADRIKELEEREKIGRSRLSEGMTTKAALKTSEAELSRTRGSLAVSEKVLEYLIGIPVQAGGLVEENLEPKTIPTLDDYLEEIESRPDVKAQTQAVNTAKQAIVVAQSALWPEISLENNNYIHREGSLSDADWDLLFTFNLPLFRGGGNLSELKRAISDWKEAKLILSKMKRDADLDIKKAYLDWSTSRDRYSSLAEAVKASEENLRLQKDEYSKSLVNNLDVLAAINQLRDAERTANEAFYQMKVDFWRLQVSTGQTFLNPSSPVTVKTSAAK